MFATRDVSRSSSPSSWSCPTRRRSCAEPVRPRPPGLVRSLGSTVYRHPDAIERLPRSDRTNPLHALLQGGLRLGPRDGRVAPRLPRRPGAERAVRLARRAPDRVDRRGCRRALGREGRGPDSGIRFGRFAPRYRLPAGRPGCDPLLGRLDRVPIARREGAADPRQDGEVLLAGLRAGGRWIAASVPDEAAGEIAIYDAANLRRTSVLRVGPSVIGESPKGLRMLRIGFSADGRRIAVPAADGLIGIREAATGNVARSLPPAAGEHPPMEDDCRYLLFTKDDQYLLAGTAAGTIRRWDVAAGRELAPMRAHRDAVRSLHLTPDGGRLISTSADGTIRRWDVATGQELRPPDGYSGSLHARLGPIGKTVLLLDSEGRMDIWDLDTGRVRMPIRPPGDLKIETPWVEPLFGFSPDGRRVYVAQSIGKIENLRRRQRPAGGLPGLAGLCARPNDLRFCISTPDGGAFLVERGRRLRRIRAADGGLIWESPDLTRGGVCYPPILARDGKSAFLPVTTYTATADEGRLELVRVELAGGKVTARVEVKSAVPGVPALIDQPRLDADGRLLLLSYNVSELFLMDAVTNRPLHHHVQFLDRPDLSPDGRQLVGYFSEGVTVYDAATGKPLSRLPIGPQTVQSLHVLPDGRHVFTSGTGGHACLWDLDAALPGAGRARMILHQRRTMRCSGEKRRKQGATTRHGRPIDLNGAAGTRSS